MNKIIEYALAKQVIEFSSKNIIQNDYILTECQNNKFIDVSAFSGLAAIKEIMNIGISPIMTINYIGKDAFLINHVFERAKDVDSIVPYFLSLLTKDDVKSISTKMADNLYEQTNQNPLVMERLFNLGFDFEQGTLNEIDKALNCDLAFFELCLTFKPDFKFNFKYNELYLDEHLMEDTNSLKNLGKDYATYISKNEILIDFLKKARDRELLKDALDIGLTINTVKKSINKI
ncbi:hypothetical protein GW796_10505 [archaeon]|nr:hypothetical protein [archaeon]